MKNNVIQFHKLNVQPNKKNKIPVFSHRVSAGIPSSAPDDSVEDMITFDEFLSINPGYTSIIYVSGNSMEPELHDRQAIIIDTLIPRQASSLEELNGKVVVAWHNGTQAIKRLQVINGKPVLVPDNPTYERIKIKETDDFQIVGILLYSLKAHF